MWAAPVHSVQPKAQASASARVHSVRSKVRPSALSVRSKAQPVRGGRSSAPAQLRPQNQGSCEESTWTSMCA